VVEVEVEEEDIWKSFWRCDAESNPRIANPESRGSLG
jgi:hypothetical protein